MSHDVSKEHVRERRLRRQFDVVFVADPFGSTALQLVRGFLVAYPHTLFGATLAWILPQIQMSLADIMWALFEGIANVWLNGGVAFIIFGYWAVALAFVVE